MKPENYWPQDKLYFYATCALFPDRLLVDEPLSSQRFRRYVPYYLNVDEQVQELEWLRQDGLLDLTVSRVDDENADYSITKIDSDEFTSRLKKYLLRYRNDELIADAGFRPDMFAVNNEQLMKYLDSSTRKEPIVNPANIWSSWTSFGASHFPFWEVVLAYQLIEAKGEIVSLGYSNDSSGSYDKEEWPFAEIRVNADELKQKAPKPQKAISHKVSIIVTSRGKLQLVIDGRRNTLRAYKSEGNDTYRAARALYDAQGEFLARKQLNLKPNSKTQLKDLIGNMRITGILAELFIEYNDNGAVCLKHKAIADEDQYERLLIHVKASGEKVK